MINKILRDLINTREVASLINNEIVEEVVKKLEENNLYIKLEKYK